MKSTVKRALELAESGNCTSIADIDRHLRREKFDDVEQHLSGKSIRKQLLRVMNANKPISTHERRSHAQHRWPVRLTD